MVEDSDAQANLTLVSAKVVTLPEITDTTVANSQTKMNGTKDIDISEANQKWMTTPNIILLALL